MSAQVTGTLEALRDRAPLVHCITNLVAMETSANLLLAAGASPVMAHAQEEIAEVESESEQLEQRAQQMQQQQMQQMMQQQQQAEEESDGE